MSEDFGLWNAFYIAVILSGIPIIVSMASGLVVAIVQAATSVQEQTVSFFVKFCSIVLIIYYCGGWGLALLINYLREALESIPML